MVVAGPAHGRAVREGRPDLAVVVGEPACAEGVRDPVADGDGGVALDLLGEDSEGALRPLGVREVAERLLEARAVPLAVGELRVVGLERRRDGDGARRAGLRDVRRHVRDLVVRQRAAECRHATAAARHLALDAIGGGLQRVEARPGRAGGTGG